MVRTSAYPTVEWLTRKRSQNQQTQSPSKPSNRTNGPTISRIERLLGAWVKEGTRISTNNWIKTPNGEDVVDIVIERNTRRIGVRFSNQYERDTDNADALVLVYGRFDALYRVSGKTDPSIRMNAADVAYALVAMYPSWFSSEGRVVAGRGAGSEVLLHSDRLAWSGALQLPGALIKRIRLSRASEWVNAFERALSPPKMISYADERSARPRR